MSWDDLNRAGPCGHAFAEAAYLDLVGRTFRGRIEASGVEEPDRVRAGARLLTRKSPIALRAVVPPYTPYSAILLDSLPTEAQTHRRDSTLEELLSTLEAKYAAIDLHLSPEMSDVRSFSWRGWNVSPLYTYRVRLDDQAEGLRWSESARRIARKEMDQFNIVETDPETVARLSVESYKRNRRRTALDSERLAGLVRSAVETLGARLFGALRTSTGAEDAAVAILTHRSVAYYWLAGGRPGPAMTVLLAGIFDRLVETGISLFDFVGANTATIAEFKRRFGGELTTYYRAQWRRGVVPALEDAIRSLR